MAGELNPESWLEARLEESPADLAARTREFIGRAGGGPLPDRLARASRLALARAVGHPHDRAAALDLLAADALVTLALAAQVEADPEGVAAFAGRLRRPPPPFPPSPPAPPRPAEPPA
jgi:hypothetical protein